MRKFVVRRTITRGEKTFYKSPKVQRLITSTRLRRKKLLKKFKLERFKLSKDNKAKYEKMLSQYLKEKKVKNAAARKEAELAKKEK